ncbi:MAG: UTP--glucose-1-phosphate uridylyltransferase [Candidatus Rokubacteria bacterium]|nr:UTP--glucose-1-phosphate uridylyltransferase [Candidatus Rokubacteria bacterium]
MIVRKAVFPAAGLGTRFLPATKAQPKEMLPLVDKPMIQYVVEEAVASGLAEIIIVTGRGKRAIEDHFDAAWELEYYLNDRGKVEELAQIKTISELVFERHGGPVLAVERVPRERLAQYGVTAARPLEDNVYEILDLVEKPRPEEAPSDLSIVGRYVLTPDVFDLLAETRADRRGEIQLTDALKALRRRRPMYAVEFEGRRYDTGDKLGFLKATVEFALARPDLADDFRAYLKSLRL